MKSWKRNTKGLVYEKGKWNSGKTKTIRVPIVLADDVLEYAHQLDKSLSDNDKSTSVTEKLDDLVSKIEGGEKGYKPNGSSQLHKELKKLSNRLKSLKEK